MCFRSGLCSFPSGSVGGASHCASSVDWERGTRGKDDKAPFEACSRGTTKGNSSSSSSSSTSECCTGQEHLGGTAKKHSSLSPC